MRAYYNEIDGYCAEWLRNLIAAGHIAPGDVDERSIVDVRASELAGYTQCHFFAGIGGWSLALRLAGWSDDRPVWTGSCPCQPFSAAGAGKATEDARHLWPAWFPLIAERKPPVVFGEQVEAAIGWGWLDTVFADLETESYACGTAILPACSVGAPHIRQRLWFVADSERGGRQQQPMDRSASIVDQAAGEKFLLQSGDKGASPRELADAERSDGRREHRHRVDGTPRAGEGEVWTGAQRLRPDPADGGATFELADTERDGGRSNQPWRQSQGRAADGWAGAEWIDCTDGKARPVEPGTFPLAHGIPNRVGRLRAYGNAIVPQAAAEFIAAFLETEAERVAA